MLENKEGNQVPAVTFPVIRNGQWEQWDSNRLFNNRTVVVFSLPGAFTPTCSSTHLPRYNELAKTFFANGVDEIICLSVNDTFVMNAWAADQKAEHVTFLPDGNGQFSEGMGMLVDKTDLGFGKRSWRYSMLVRNGVIEKMFIEPNKPGDPFEVSDADTMLEYLAPTAKKPEFVSLFTKAGCPHCARAKTLLTDNDYEFEEIQLGDEVSSRSLRAVSNKGTVPQVYIGGNHIGGADDLEQFLAGTS